MTDADWTVASWQVAPEKLFDLSGRVALVTGAASGLGRAIALGLDRFGAQVVLADLDASGSQQVADHLRQKSMFINVDVTDPEQARSMVDGIMGQCGRLDVAFNVPGITVRKPVVDMSDEEWRKVMDVNLNGVFWCAREEGRVMLRQGFGSVVNMGSARGIFGGPSQSSYSASKAAVIHLTRCLAMEWAPIVRVNALAPGHMATPFVKPIMKDPERYDSMRRLEAMKRFGLPEEIVGPAVFLASDASSFVTGAVLSVDGGWTAGSQ
jgi:gluconate 5-dehydrogenase